MARKSLYERIKYAAEIRLIAKDAGTSAPNFRYWLCEAPHLITAKRARKIAISLRKAAQRLIEIAADLEKNYES